MSGRRAVASNAEDSSTAADGPLRGLRVLDLSTRWGMYASKLLADLGADVIKVEPPVGSEQRAIGPFVRELGAEGSVFFWYHNTSKRSVTIDLDTEEGVESLRRLAASADVLIEGYPVGYLPERSLGYEDLRRINDGLIYASISPFGQSGPRAHWAGDDIVAAAMGGLMNLCGMPESPPSQPGGAVGSQATIQSDACAAFGVLGALIRRDQTGKGQYIDVSMQEAVAVVNENALGYYAVMGIVRPRVGLGSIAVSGPNAGKLNTSGSSRSLRRSRDGWVYGSPTNAPFDVVRGWIHDEGIELPDWFTEEWWNTTDRFLRLEKLGDVLDELFMQLDGEELFHRAQRFRTPIAPVRDAAAVYADPQLRSRGFWVEVEHPELERSVLYPGAPFQLQSGGWQIRSGPPLLGEHNSLLEQESPWREGPMAVPAAPADQQAAPLAGVTVIDFSWQAAVPVCTKYLAALGATVIKVESAGHPDFLRTVYPRPVGNTSINASHIFNNFNAGKLSLELNMTQESSQRAIRELIKKSDVIVDNFGVDPFPKWGLSVEEIRRINPGIIVARSSVMGRTGPCKDYTGLGYTISALGGLNSLMGFPGDPPIGPCIAYPDYSSNPFHLGIAIMAALHRKRMTGLGDYIDLSQTESSIAFWGHAILAFEATGVSPEPQGNTSDWASPHGAYRCKPTSDDEERWAVIACNTEDEWRALADALSPGWLDDPRFATLESRVAHRAALDDVLAKRCAAFDAYELVGLLQSRRVPAGVIQNHRDLLDRDEHMRERGFYVWMDHPELGRIPHDGLPFRLSDTPGELRAPAPLLGEHTVEVLRDVIGISDEQFVELMTSQG